MVAECRAGLSIVLPLNDAERNFLDKILDDGEICLSLITNDEELAGRIINHPGLAWKALNVREYKESGKQRIRTNTDGIPEI